MRRKGSEAPSSALVRRDRERFQRLYGFMEKGVVIVDPLTTFVGENVRIGAGTVINPLTVIESDVTIGKGCEIGPFARVRRNVSIRDGACVGNFVEVVRSSIGRNSKVKHLTYIGDCLVEDDVNVGAGTIIANYDGKQKNPTRIDKGAFIGSGSILIAPVKIGRRSVTGAGAVVTRNRDVPDGETVVGIPAKKIAKGKSGGR
ncbi:MAG: DapH/DapD/GlmU-related protein [Deltaproteobacteria bacterium]